ncbi:LuxR C-terminal-related transcriptional regulator [Dactylosporangium sp. CA-139114]|uniref:LuxR C-terminal-related transcriptional regulator n=1 Tax=Dactylosporangium sp. CA-139114 TaxID=3239931 RepID=UPI003D954102
MAAGLSNQRIGTVLYLSSHTVASYLETAMRRMQVANRAAVVAKCYVLGVLDATCWPPEPTGKRCISAAPANSIQTPN